MILLVFSGGGSPPKRLTPNRMRVSMIEVKSVSKNYGTTRALDQVSFSVEKQPNPRLPGTKRGGQEHGDEDHHDVLVP